MGEGSEHGKFFFFKSEDCLDAYDFKGDYLIGEEVIGGCWMDFEYWDEWTKMRKALINKLDIIIFLDFLNGIKLYEIAL